MSRHRGNSNASQHPLIVEPWLWILLLFRLTAGWAFRVAFKVQENHARWDLAHDAYMKIAKMIENGGHVPTEHDALVGYCLVTLQNLNVTKQRKQSQGHWVSACDDLDRLGAQSPTDGLEVYYGWLRELAQLLSKLDCLEEADAVEGLIHSRLNKAGAAKCCGICTATLRRRLTRAQTILQNRGESVTFVRCRQRRQPPKSC